MNHGLDRVGLKTEFVKKTLVYSLVCVLDPFIKIRSVICSSSQHRHVFPVFMFWFSIFGLTDLGFHE